MVGLDLSVALDVLLSVDLVIMERSLSLLTKVLICANPRPAFTVVDLNKATSTSLRRKMLNKNQKHVPQMSASSTKPSTHCVRVERPCSVSKK